MATTPLPTPEDLRERFAALTEQRDTIVAASTPLREERDALVERQRAETAALDQQISEIEGALFDIDQERAGIARALGGRTSLA